MLDYLRVGVVASAHGLKGELNVYPTTDEPARFEDLDEVILVHKGSRRTLPVENVRYFKNMVILKLGGIDSRNDSEVLHGAELMIPREKAIPLADGEYFIGDLVGLEVWTDEGEKFGVLSDVLQTGANDVYVVKSDTDHRDHLFPVTEECVKEVDPEAGRITVHILPGLLDL